MIDITSILKSDSLVVICIGVILLSGLIVLIYKMNKNSLKRLQKQNTKELNDTLTMEIIEEQNSPVVIVPEETKKEEVIVPVANETIYESEPVTIIDDSNLQKDIVEALAKEQEEIEILEENPEVTVNDIVEEEKASEVEIIKEEVLPEIEEKKEITTRYEVNEKENLVYAPIELNQQEAREALEKLQIELAEKEEQEELEEYSDEKNIELTNFEKEQEENAIISLDELMKRGSEIYSSNEQIGYEDEGDEPITIEQLQEKWQKEKEKIEQIEIEEKIETIEQKQEENKVAVENTVVEIKDEQEEAKKEVKKVEFPSILPTRKEAYESKFENSPIISPVYGIERKKYEEQERLHPELIQNNDLTLENTANYEKFDEEIKKTNEFIEALKELQKKLD